MRSITVLPNTEAPDSDFPYGRFKNTVGANAGTRVNESMVGDWAQFFAKIMDEAGITPNELPDSEYSGWQLFEALKGVFGGLRRKTIPIGVWNMDTTASVTVAHGLTIANVRSVSFVIINDAGTFVTNGLNPVSFATDASPLVDATAVTLARRASGVYDDAAYSGSGNRGYVVIDYVE